MEEGKDVLIMDLCKDTVPENQEFVLQEVSESAAFCTTAEARFTLSLLPVSDTGNFTSTLGGDYRVRVCGSW